MFGWVGFSCPWQTARYHCADRLLAPAGSWTKPMGLISWAGLYGLCCLDADKRMLGNLTKTLALPENPMGLVRRQEGAGGPIEQEI